MSRWSQSYFVRRSRVALANLLPDKQVRRTVQGVELVLPRSHALPFYALDDSPYGQNLVELARGIGAAEGSVVLLDVGANIGDSTAQVLAAVDGHAVCIEPDPRWLPYLEQNVAGRAEIEPALLLTRPATTNLAPDHYKPGTTRYVETDEAGAASLTVDELAERHPVLSGVRLVKSDTDGYDVDLVPVIARVFAASQPVLFFEFHPGLTRQATPDVDPDGVWQLLHDLGYEQAAVWHNYGHPLGSAPTVALSTYSHVLEEQGAGASDYWDVAVAHRDDSTGLAVLAQLMPTPLRAH